MKVLCVLGTRPEAIKLAPVVHELERDELIVSKVCVTGQHREMLDQVLGLFDITPDFDLDIMRPGQSLTHITTETLRRLAPILQAEAPDWMVVQGDTTTTLAASLAAFYHGVPVAHVEAGLRSASKHNPHPEELNRRLVDAIADLHLAPTPGAAENLRREGHLDDSIVVTGNTVIDALLAVQDRPFDPTDSPLASVPVRSKRIVIASAHRRENGDAELIEICEGLSQLAAAGESIHIVCPVHPNPNVVGPFAARLGHAENVTLCPMLSYDAMVWLLSHSDLVISDSGGFQEEAAYLGKPVLVVRDTTERTEGLEAGVSMLIGADRAAVFGSAMRLLEGNGQVALDRSARYAYGTGDAARRTVAVLRERAGAITDPGWLSTLG